MKKSILIGLGLAVSVASTVIAQTPDSNGDRGRKGKRGGESGQMEGRRGGRGGPDGLLLKGITLTEGQRSQIAQVDKAQRDKLDAQRKQNKGEAQKMRDARQRGDTAAIRVAMTQRRTQMEQERAQHIAAIRNILTADQRVQFDKNVAELQTREAQRAQRGEFGRGDRAQGQGKKRGERPARGGQLRGGR